MNTDTTALEIITRAEAKKRGLKRYFTGKPCKHGHVAVRHIAGRCIECRKMDETLYHKDIDKKRLWARNNYYKHRESRLAAVRKWTENNPEKVAKIKQEWAINNKDKVSEIQRKFREKNPERAKEIKWKWRKENPEKQAAARKAWSEANPARIRQKAMERLMKKRQAMPSWLSQSHLDEMTAIYKQAAELTEQTGIKYHVDHIVPLQGKTVSGLHVPWNLQILEAAENIRKSNRLEAA